MDWWWDHWLAEGLEGRGRRDIVKVLVAMHRA